MDILESIGINLTDSIIDNSEVKLIAYNIRMPSLQREQESEVYNPKKFPLRAIDIDIKPDPENDIRIFLNTKTREWDSCVNNSGKLTPDQIGDFFKTDFFHKVYERVRRDWPVSDPFYSDLCKAIEHKKVNIDPYQPERIDEDGEFNKYNIDKERSKEKNVAGVQRRTNSGRKIVTFSDFGIEKKDQARYYCWPKRGSEFKWSQWNLADKVYDKKKTNPLFIRCRFFHAGYEYGLSLGLKTNIDNNRGFSSYNLTLEPKLQWCTPIETTGMLQLTIIQKFLRTCKQRIEEYLSIPNEEIYENINNPEKITLDQIENTKKLIRLNLPIVREPRADKFIYD